MAVLKQVRKREHRPYYDFGGPVLTCHRCWPARTEQRAIDVVMAGPCERCGVQMSTEQGTGVVVWMLPSEAVEFREGY